MAAQVHQSDTRILDRRTLENDHRVLASLLQPGMSVLDVGCGTGAITAGIAKAVGPSGAVVGIDRDRSLLDIARREHGDIANLQFEHGDATSLAYQGHFDIVTAARTLQWISDPAVAVAQMAAAAKSDGLVVILDYNHNANEWQPEPPASFRTFYQAFLSWRVSNRWDNDMADHLPRLFAEAGLADIKSEVQDEVASRQDPDFATSSVLWQQVMENVGSQFFDGPALAAAQSEYSAWIKNTMQLQRLALKVVVGKAH